MATVLSLHIGPRLCFQGTKKAYVSLDLRQVYVPKILCSIIEGASFGSISHQFRSDKASAFLLC